MEKIGEVFVTTDYDQFGIISANRQVDSLNVNRIVESMKKSFLVTIALVIRVDDGLSILDGQHRLAACRFLDKPFYYCIVDDLEAEKMDVSAHTLPNLQATKRWAPYDYVRFYAVMGNEDYRQLKNFIDETGLPAIAAHICLTGKAAVAMPTNFRAGGFKVNDLERGYKLAEIINVFKNGGMGSASHPLFVSAVFKGLMRHTINLDKLQKAAINKLPIIYRWIGSSVGSTLMNLEAYSHADRGLQKRHVEFKVDAWPYTI